MQSLLFSKFGQQILMFLTTDMLRQPFVLDITLIANFAKDWINSGATLIGGCCEVGPAHIAELKRKFG